MPDIDLERVLTDLRLRYAECHMIDLTLSRVNGQHRLAGVFQPRRDGVIRRHVYDLGPVVADQDRPPEAALAAALERFADEIHRTTRIGPRT